MAKKKGNVVSILEESNGKTTVRISNPDNKNVFKEAVLTNKEKLQIAKALLWSAKV